MGPYHTSTTGNGRPDWTAFGLGCTWLQAASAPGHNQPADLLILNKVDYGVTRTDYRDVARDLGKALNMNYAYGVEFLEVDPLNLGLEKVVMEENEAEADIQKSFGAPG